MAEEVAAEELDITDELIAERRSEEPGETPSDMTPWMRPIVSTIDRMNLWVGRLTCLLLVPIIFVMVWEVVARKMFLAPTDFAYEYSRMLAGAMFMLGAGYALLRGVHIRADFIYRNWSVRTQGRIDAALYLILYFPALLIFAKVAFDYAAVAITRGERGMDTAWMPPLGPIKAALAAGVMLLLLQGVAELCKSWYAATKGRWPDA